MNMKLKASSVAVLYISIKVFLSYTPLSSSQSTSTSLWFLSLQTHMARQFFRITVPTRFRT